MGPRASKIDFDRIILDGFDPIITFMRSVCVRNTTFDRFLKIFENLEKSMKKSNFQNRQKIVLNRSKNKNLDFYFFNDFVKFLAAFPGPGG